MFGRVPYGAKRILDVGCGQGGNARRLTARGAMVDGITLSPIEAEYAAPHCANVYIHDLENGLPQLPYGRLYDVVLCSHVLEHIAYPDRLLTDIHGRLAPDGVLVVALPNLLQWKSRIRLLRGRFDYTEMGLMDRTHVRWYSFDSGRQLLERHAFKVIEAVVEGGFPLGPLRRLLPARLLKPVDSVACRMAPGLLGYEMLYVARAG